MEKLDILHLQFFPVGLDSVPVSGWKDYSSFRQVLAKNLLKIACFLQEGLRLLESLFETIPSSDFVRETLRKSDIVVNGEKPIWETQEVMAELGIVLNLRTKTFSH